MKKVFLSGIAGTGMSALAGLFHARGDQVFGSDSQFYPPVDGILQRMGAQLFHGYDPTNIPADTDFCVIGNVIARGNPEAEFILDSGREYYSLPEALYRFFIKGKKSVVVAGSHGKTTMASFIAHLLYRAGLKPGFFIGGLPRNFKRNSRPARGDYFISEGDEYDSAFFDRTSKFLKYRPTHLILTALDHDHLDFFPSIDLYVKSFRDLVNQVPAGGMIIINGDVAMTVQAVTNAFTPVFSYGEGSTDYRIADIQPLAAGFRFSLVHGRRSWPFVSCLDGRYNIWNLSAGIVFGLRLGIEVEVIQNAVRSFRGVERRLSKLSTIGQTVFLEDFAHHPTAIAAVLESLRQTHPHHCIKAIFEPRSWSLRRNFFQDRLAASFAAADRVVIKDVYEKEKIAPAERLDVARLRSELLAQGKEVLIFNDYDEIKRHLTAGDFHRPQLVVLLSNGGFGDLANFVRQLALNAVK